MSIKIFNTLTREKEAFKPLEEGKVSMYVCGPTVYNYIHIGNARPAIVFDTVRRYLEYRGYDVDYVLNFTDVDDKIIKAANELGEEVPEVADRFIDAYLEDVGALGVKMATHHPRVMDTMDDIIEFVNVLVDKGYAYEADGDVYFRPRAFEDYGKLSHQSVDELRAGARIQVGEKKKTLLILHFGSKRRMEKLPGMLHGAKEGQAGILNALQWQRNILEKQLTFMQADRI